MKLTKGDLAIMAILGIGTAVATYFVSAGSIPATILGLLIGVVGGIIPKIVISFSNRK